MDWCHQTDVTAGGMSLLGAWSLLHRVSEIPSSQIGPMPLMPTAPNEVPNVGHGCEQRPDAQHPPPAACQRAISANEECGDEALGGSWGDPNSLPLPLPQPCTAELQEKPLRGVTSSAAQLRRGKKKKEKKKKPAQARQAINKSWRSGRQQPQGLSEAARKAGARWLRHSMPLCFPKKKPGYP